MSESTLEWERQIEQILSKLNQPLFDRVDKMQTEIDQMELQNDILQDELSKTLSLVLEELSVKDESKKERTAITVITQKGKFWNLALSSLSHFGWDENSFSAFFLTSSGEKIVKIKSGDKEIMSRKLSESLIDRIQNGDDIGPALEIDGAILHVEIESVS